MVWFAYGCMELLVRFPPTLSISSINITQGATFFASSETFSIQLDYRNMLTKWSEILAAAKRTEKLSDFLGASANKQLVKFRARELEEGNARLSSDSLGEHRLTDARFANEKHSLWKTGAHRKTSILILEEVDDVLKFFLRLVTLPRINKKNRTLWI